MPGMFDLDVEPEETKLRRELRGAHTIIAALVARVGGRVDLSLSEVAAAPLALIWEDLPGDVRRLRVRRAEVARPAVKLTADEDELVHQGGRCLCGHWRVFHYGAEDGSAPGCHACDRSGSRCLTEDRP